MKKILFSFATVAMMFGLYSCGGGTAKTVVAENPNGQEIGLTRSEAITFQAPGKRAFGKGVSFDESTARQLAELDARTAFSNALDAAIVSAAKKASVEITQYAGGNNDGRSNTDGGGKINTLSSSISANIIRNTSVIMMDKFFGMDRQYTIYVCLEYQGSPSDIAKEAAEQVKQGVSDADREKIQRELDSFQKEIENKLNNR